MQRAWATHFDVAGSAVGGREDFAPASFAFAPLLLLLLLDLKGFGTLLQAVVVVGQVYALDLVRRLSNGYHQFSLCCLKCGRFPVPRDDC